MTVWDCGEQVSAPHAQYSYRRGAVTVAGALRCLQAKYLLLQARGLPVSPSPAGRFLICDLCSLTCQNLFGDKYRHTSLNQYFQNLKSNKSQKNFF